MNEIDYYGLDFGRMPLQNVLEEEDEEEEDVEEEDEEEGKGDEEAGSEGEGTLGSKKRKNQEDVAASKRRKQG
jgi:hypothetical protein